MHKSVIPKNIRGKVWSLPGGGGGGGGVGVGG